MYIVFNDTATTEIYTLSLHDALPISLLIKGGCIGCHMISGSRVAVGRLGPNLTHIGTRTTIAAGQFPNTTEYLARWLKKDRKSTRLNSSHANISYAVFCLKKKKIIYL